MADKTGLRRVRGKAIKPRPPKPKPVSRNIEATGGPIYMPIRAGDPDTEIHFVASKNGRVEVVGIVRLKSMTMGLNQGVTASFADLSHFAPYQVPPTKDCACVNAECINLINGNCTTNAAPGPDSCSHPQVTFEGVCVLCGFVDSDDNDSP